MDPPLYSSRCACRVLPIFLHMYTNQTIEVAAAAVREVVDMDQEDVDGGYIAGGFSNRQLHTITTATPLTLHEGVFL